MTATLSDEAAPVERRRPRVDVGTANAPDYDQLVGREAELGVLKAELDATLRGVGQTVLIAGEPGVGKTQLSRHFLRWAQGQLTGDSSVQALSARFFDYDGSQLAPYEVFLNLLTEIAGIQKSTDPAAKLDEVQKFVRDTTGSSLPKELLEGPEPTTDQGDDYRVIAPLADVFRDLSRIKPLVLVLDDLQWADPGSPRGSRLSDAYAGDRATSDRRSVPQ